jgi:hypothetical protein
MNTFDRSDDLASFCGRTVKGKREKRRSRNASDDYCAGRNVGGI